MCSMFETVSFCASKHQQVTKAEMHLSGFKGDLTTDPYRMTANKCHGTHIRKKKHMTNVDDDIYDITFMTYMCKSMQYIYISYVYCISVYVDCMK